MSRKAGISRGGALRVGFGRRHVATTVGRYTTSELMGPSAKMAIAIAVLILLFKICC
jgi:hypothetical protein